MKFKKYSSIEQHLRQKAVNYVMDNGLDTGEWVQLLKIHGANYSYFCNASESQKGKRTSFLGEGFYGDHHFDYTDNVTDLFTYLRADFDFEVLAVYGEIYGGVYNHPDVPKLQGFTKVQKEVHYCQENRFSCFDIELNGVPCGWDTVQALCEKFDIPIVPELGRGSFEELIMSETVFPDPLHKQFGLPTIEDNDAEGWVMKPLDERTFKNGERVIFKGRNPKFKDKNQVKKSPKILKLTDAGNEIKDILFSYINENRLHNVISHGTVIKQKDFGKLLGMFAQDVFNDFRKDHQEKFELLELDEQGIVKKFMSREAGNVIRPHFTDIIDGEF